MKLWSPVVSAKAWIFSCGTSIHDDGPKPEPTSIALMRERLRGLLDRLVGLVAGGLGARDERRADALRDALLRDHALGHVPSRRQLEHHVEQRALDDRPQAAGAGLALERAVGDLPHRVLGEDELDAVVTEEALVLLDERVLRLLEDLDEVFAPQLVHGGDDREPADELRDQPEVEEVLRHHVREHLRRLDVVLRADVGAEADGVLADPPGDDLVEAGERAAADEEDVGGVDREELLVRVLASALRRHRSDRPLEDLQQGLLHALARHVARDRRVVRLARDLVDFVDVDDPGLGLLDVEVRRLDQLQEDVLDVLTHVAGFGESRRICNRERDVQDLGQRLRQQRLAAARGTEQKDVRLLQLDLALFRLHHLHALVVVVDRYREGALGVLLPDDVLLEDGVDLLRLREVLDVEGRGPGELLVDDLVTEIDALVADVDARAGDQLLDLSLGLAAEAAEELFVRVGRAGQGFLPFSCAQGTSLAVRDDLVDQVIFLRLFGGHEVIALGIARDLFQILACVLGKDLVQPATDVDDLLRVDLDVSRLSLEAGGNLMDQDLRVGKRKTLALCAARQEQCAHGHRDADADCLHVGLDELNRVVDRETRVHRPAGRVDVERDVLVGVLRLQVNELGHDEVRDVIRHGRAEKDDSLVEQPRVDVERAFTARRLLYDHRDQWAHQDLALFG